MRKEYSGHFLDVFLREMKLKRPIIVSASMSGIFVLPYMMNPEPDTCTERLRAFVALAPVATEKFEHAAYHHCEVRS